jgi:hypothetical protein
MNGGYVDVTPLTAGRRTAPPSSLDSRSFTSCLAKGGQLHACWDDSHRSQDGKWLHQRLQDYLRHRLRHAIRDRGYPERTYLTVSPGYLYESRRRRKVTPRPHPVSDLIEIPLQILLEHQQRLAVHPGGTTVGLHQLPRPQDKLFGNTVWLCLRHALLPLRVDPFLRPAGPAPSLHPS